jgi:hypothetical protein
MDTEISIEQLAKLYIKIRTAIAEKEEQHKKELEELESSFSLVSDKILEICAEQGLDSIRTPEGTITRRVSSRYWTSDWDSMYKFIRDNDALYLLEQRIHNSHMKQFLEEHPDKLPAGLQNERKYAVQVRKPTAK